MSLLSNEVPDGPRLRGVFKEKLVDRKKEKLCKRTNYKLLCSTSLDKNPNLKFKR